jgi:hypothetical protein
MTDMHTVVLVGEDFIAATNDEALERPVSLTNTKFTTTRIIEVDKPADDDLLSR